MTIMGQMPGPIYFWYSGDLSIATLIYFKNRNDLYVLSSLVVFLAENFSKKQKT